MVYEKFDEKERGKREEKWEEKWEIIWPLMLIAVGVSILLGGLFRRR